MKGGIRQQYCSETSVVTTVEFKFLLVQSHWPVYLTSVVTTVEFKYLVWVTVKSGNIPSVVTTVEFK